MDNLKNSKQLFDELFVFPEYKNTPAEQLQKLNLSEAVAGDKALVFVYKVGAEGISEALEKMVFKMAEALKLDKESVMILGLKEGAILPFHQLINLVKSEKYVFFGLVPADLMMSVEVIFNQVYEINHKRLLFAPNLVSVSTDKSVKMSLWTGLKEL